MTARILLVRHRQSTWNADRRWAGQANPPLSVEGRRQALELGANLSGFGFQAIVSSDLSRARETARRVRAAMPRAVLRTDARLREIDIPAWDGMTKEDIEAAFPGQLHRWKTIDPPEPPPGSEPWPAFESRVRSALLDCADQWTSALVVAHSGVLRVLRTAAPEHGKVGRSKGIWLERHGDQFRIAGLQRLVERPTPPTAPFGSAA